MFPDVTCLRMREGFRKHLCVFCNNRAVWVLHTGIQYCSRCRDLAFELFNILLEKEK